MKPAPRFSFASAAPAPRVRPSVPGVRVRRAGSRRREQCREQEATFTTNVRQETVAVFTAIVRELAGLTVRGETAVPGQEALELVVEVEFSGPRTGRVVLAIGRGLTRRIGANMAGMLGLDGQPLNAIEAAKELANGLAHALLSRLFGTDGGFRLAMAQVSSPRPLRGTQLVALELDEGLLAVDVELGQAAVSSPARAS